MKAQQMLARGVQTFGILGPHWKKSFLGHTLKILQHVTTKKSHNVLSKFTILCGATFIAILSCTPPTGRRQDTNCSVSRDLNLHLEPNAPIILYFTHIMVKQAK